MAPHISNWLQNSNKKRSKRAKMSNILDKNGVRIMWPHFIQDFGLNVYHFLLKLNKKVKNMTIVIKLRKIKKVGQNA